MPVIYPKSSNYYDSILVSVGSVGKIKRNYDRYLMK